ncbi:MAG: porin family protein [Alphaproteobacteria bacterium]|nr:porin family protein [Alphaproteobacteria bacterium]
MKKIFFLLALLLFSPSVRAETSDDGFYTRWDTGGIYSTETPLKKGINVQAGFGHKWADMFRGEFTIEYARIVMKGPQAYNGEGREARTHLTSFTAMATAYVDLFEYKNIAPYVGAGAGVSHNRLPDAVVDGRQFLGDAHFRAAWKITGGVGILLPKDLVLDINYVYTDLGRFSTKTFLSPLLRQDVAIRKVNIGLRYNF